MKLLIVVLVLVAVVACCCLRCLGLIEKWKLLKHTFGWRWLIIKSRLFTRKHASPKTNQKQRIVGGQVRAIQQRQHGHLRCRGSSSNSSRGLRYCWLLQFSLNSVSHVDNKIHLAKSDNSSAAVTTKLPTTCRFAIGWWLAICNSSVGCLYVYVWYIWQTSAAYCCPAHYCQKLLAWTAFVVFIFAFYLIFTRSVRIFTLPKCPSALLTETTWPPEHTESELNSAWKLRLNSLLYPFPPYKNTHTQIFVIRFLNILPAYPLTACFVVIVR